MLVFLRTGRIVNGQLWNLNQTRFDGVHEAEIIHDPRERAIRLLAHAPKKVRRGRKVHAEVDSPSSTAPQHLVYTIETVHTHGRFFEEFFGFFYFTKIFLLGVTRSRMRLTSLISMARPPRSSVSRFGSR